MEGWAEVQQLFEEVLASRTKQHGPAHAEKVHAKASLPSLLVQRGDLAGARQLWEEVVPGLRA